MKKLFTVENHSLVLLFLVVISSTVSVFADSEDAQPCGHPLLESCDKGGF